MILMLTVSPLAWAYVVYLALITYPQDQLNIGAGFIALFFLITAILFDYVFFGIIRGAMDELYHPTTHYGYGFLLVLPFLLALIFKKRIEARKREVRKIDRMRALLVGFFCFLFLIVIIKYDLNPWGKIYIFSL